MGHELSDTDHNSARVHLALLRGASPERRLNLALSMSRSIMSLARSGLAQTLPSAASRDVGLQFVARFYDADLAEAVRVDLAARQQ